MSVKIDPANVDPKDYQYLLDRPWMVDEFRRQGFIAEMDAVAEGVKVRNDPNEEVKITTDQMRVGTQAPQQIDPRPSGVGNPDDELDDDYESWTVADLKTEIGARNSEPERTEKLSLSGNKEELAARLHEDDAADASA